MQITVFNHHVKYKVFFTLNTKVLSAILCQMVTSYIQWYFWELYFTYKKLMAPSDPLIYSASENVFIFKILYFKI